MINLTIDNKKISVPKGTKIIEAAKKAGIDIPHLCHHTGLEPFGGCRLCVVEVEGTHELVSSCVMPVEENMVVLTSTPRINKARQTIIELLLLNHPMDCLVCERCGDCRLQDLAYRLKVNFNVYKMEKRVTPAAQIKGIIEINPKKCTHCGLCVRACREIRMVGAIDFSYRGFKTEVGTPFRKSIDCEFCGQCISICPVAGVISTLSKYDARVWEIGKHNTICPYCGCGCSISLNVKDHKVISVSSREDLGINNGNLCAKGRFGYDFPNSPLRLTNPLIKKEGILIETSWEETIKFSANKFREIKEKYGPDSIAGIISARCTNEEVYLFQKFMRIVIGTNNIDNSSRLENGANIDILSSMLGYPAMTNPMNDLLISEVIVVIGANPVESQSIAALKIKGAVKRSNAKLILIDPRKTKLNSFARLWLSPNIQTDSILLNVISKIIIDENLHNKEFIKENSTGFEELRSSINNISIKDVSKITDIPEEKIFEAARLIGKSKKTAFVYGSGVTQQKYSTETVKAIVNLSLLTGNIGKEGTGVYPLKGYNNSQGACDMGALPEYLPGYRKFDDPAAQTKFSSIWGKELPKTPGITYHQIFGKIMEKKIRAVYIIGDDPIASFPDTEFLKLTLIKLDFIVMNDLFLNNTTPYANIVFPAASFTEKEGTYTNMERRVQNFKSALKPGKNIKTDSEIIGLLSKELGYPLDPSVKNIRKEISELVPDYQGLDVNPFPQKGIQWPFSKTNTDGTPVLYTDKKNKFTFIIPENLSFVQKENTEYPFILLSGGSLFHSHSGAMTRNSKGLHEVCPEGFVGINPNDAENLKAIDSELIRISSGSGSTTVKVHLDNNIPRGILFAPVHFFEEMHINNLFPWELNPVSKSLINKSTRVKIEKI
ncbi:MAG: molybdopterin-dependent oxidoreductase [bacterium]|nr:molybdopterin-dependent oxidoreductase [bacterium]